MSFVICKIITILLACSVVSIRSGLNYSAIIQATAVKTQLKQAANSISSDLIMVTRKLTLFVGIGTRSQARFQRFSNFPKKKTSPKIRQSIELDCTPIILFLVFQKLPF